MNKEPQIGLPSVDIDIDELHTSNSRNPSNSLFSLFRRLQGPKKKKICGAIGILLILALTWGIIMNMSSQKVPPLSDIDDYSDIDDSDEQGSLIDREHDPNYTPEDWVIQDAEPQNVDLPENVTITFAEKSIVIVPWYKDQHSLTLKIINFNGEHKKFPISINNRSDTETMLEIKSDYETQDIVFPTMKFTKRDLHFHTQVPRTIVQTYQTRNVTRKKYLSVRTVVDQNPNYRYRFFDDKARSQYIRKNFNKTVYAAYAKLIPGAFRADFFRYSYLYKDGGVYMDCKMVAAQNFDKWLSLGYNLYLSMDFGGTRQYSNTIMAGAPGIEPLRALINLVVSHIQEKFMGENCLDPTGPGALFMAINPFVVNYPDNKWKVLVHERITGGDQPEFGLQWTYQDLGVLAYMFYPHYYDENSYHKKSYQVLYLQNKVYKP